jgi:hypothetical protein
VTYIFVNISQLLGPVLPSEALGTTTKTMSLEISKCIPVLAYNQKEENDENIIMDGDLKCDDHNKSPPEYVMIELNGELIAPVEYPSADTCRIILGKESTVELGKLRLDDANKVRLVEIYCLHS